MRTAEALFCSYNVLREASNVNSGGCNENDGDGRGGGTGRGAVRGEKARSKTRDQPRPAAQKGGGQRDAATATAAGKTT